MGIYHSDMYYSARKPGKDKKESKFTYCSVVGPGRGLGLSRNAIWWNLAIFFYVQAENRPSERRVDVSLAKSLVQCIIDVNFYRTTANLPVNSLFVNHFVLLSLFKLVLESPCILALESVQSMCDAGSIWKL